MTLSLKETLSFSPNRSTRNEGLARRHPAAPSVSLFRELHVNHVGEGPERLAGNASGVGLHFYSTF